MASLTDVEYDTDVDATARSRYAPQPQKKEKDTVVVQMPATKQHDDAYLTEDEDLPPPLESVPLNPSEVRDTHPPLTVPLAHTMPLPVDMPQDFQAHQKLMVQHFWVQQKEMMQMMSTPEYIAETEELFVQLPPSVQKDLMVQIETVPAEMRVVGRSQLTRQATSWKQHPNQTFLLLGVKRNNLALVRMCVEEMGADVDFTDGDGNCALHWAVWYKIVPMAEYLISRGANPNVSNLKGQRPVHWACMGGNLSCVRVLVKARCQLDVQDADGYYPTHAASQHGKTAVLEYLKLNGADLHALDGSQRTVLHWSAFKNELITTQYLVNQGLSLDARDSGGRLALHWASSQNNLDIVSYLVGKMEEVQNFSALELKDFTLSSTPREIAVAKNAVRVAKYLKEVQTRLELTRFQKIYQRILCINQSSFLGLGGSNVANDTTKNLAGTYITAWYFFVLSLVTLHHWLIIIPNTSEEAVSSTQQQLLILGEFLAAAFWLVVHYTNPGYLPKNLGGMKTAFDRGNNPGSVVPTAGSSPRSPASPAPSEGDTDDTTDEHSAMIQMEEMGGKEPISSDHFTYEQCLEKGYADFVCVSCRIVKPLRSKHCSNCDRCVTTFDHHCPFMNTCIGSGNHRHFVGYLLYMVCIMLYHVYVAVKFLRDGDNNTWPNWVAATPLMAHSVFMAVYAGILFGSQYGAVFQSMTTNEQFNGWRYRYMKADPKDPSGRTMTTPFDEGCVRNFLSFFRCRKQKHVAATVEMAEAHSSGAAVANNSGGGQQLAAAAFDWDGVEHLQQGMIVTQRNEEAAHAVTRFLAYQKAVEEGKLNPSPQSGGHGHGGGGGGGHGHSHGGRGGGGGHGHSHGGRECHGHN